MGTEYIEKHIGGGSDQIKKSGHPLNEILKDSVRVSVTNSYKKSQKGCSLTFFIFEFFESIWEE